MCVDVDKASKRTLFIAISIGFLLCLLFIGCGDARQLGSGDKYIIENGDLVFNGEESLNFSQFNSAGNNVSSFRNRANPDTDFIDVNDITSVSIPAGKTGTYCPVYAPYANSSQLDTTKTFKTTSFSNALSTLYINISNSASHNNTINIARSADQAIIKDDVYVSYFFKNSQYATELAKLTTDISDWYQFKYAIDNKKGTIPRSSTSSPVTGSDKFTFKSIINSLSSSANTDAADIYFEPNLKSISNNNNYKISVKNTIEKTGKFKVNPDPVEITIGKSQEITINPNDGSSLAILNYTYTLTPANKGVYFKENDTSNDALYYLERIVDTTDKSREDTNKLTIYANTTADIDTEYYLEISNGYYTTLVSINIKDLSKPEITLSQDALDGKFSVGDVIKVKVSWSDAPENITGTLTLNGQNLKIVLLSNIDFTKDVEYYLQTKTLNGGTNLDVGTYTLSLTTTAPNKNAKDVSFYIGKPTVALTVNGGTNAPVVHGEKLNLQWYASGSPNAIGESQFGEIHWYIFGINHASSGKKTFRLIDSGKEFGVDVPSGYGYYNYSVNFTRDLDVGTYSILIDHPGADNIFAIEPDGEFFDTLSSLNFNGKKVSIADFQTPNAFQAIQDMINSAPDSDDIMVLGSFSIEEPWIRLTEITADKESTSVGTKFSLKGDTNYPVDKVMTLSISPGTFIPEGVTNSAMMMTAGYDVTLKDNSSYGYSLRDFEVKDIDTSTWDPGTYIVTFTIDGVKDPKTFSITLNADMTITSDDIEVPVEKVIEYDYTPPVSQDSDNVTVTPTIAPTSTPTTVPTTQPAKSSSTFLGGISPIFLIIIGVGVILIAGIAIFLVKNKRRNKYDYLGGRRR